VRTAAAQPGVTALEGSVFVSGAAVQWLRDGLGILVEAAETERLARSIESTGGVHFIPALAGLGSPHWRPDVRGVISGITGGTGRAHLARAALEAIAFQVRDVVEVLPDGLTALRADGGATVNGWLMQFQADILGMPVEVASEHETTAMGAAALAGLAVGLWRDGTAVAESRQPATVVEPRMSRDEADERYSGWLTALQGATG
jgi:glycerol kinase